MPHPPPTAGILAGPLPAPFLLLLSACAGAAVSGFARSPCHASRSCPCRTARLSPVLDTGHPRPRRQLSRNPSGTTGGGCGIGTLTPAPRSRWLCVRVAPCRGVPRLTSLVAGTTSSPVVRVRIAMGICYQGPRCPTGHPPRGSLPASCQLLFYCFVALAPAQLSPA